MNDHTTITQRRAQKLHCCDDCGLPILRGNEYITVRGQQDGRYIYRKAHIHCDAVISAYSADAGCEVDRSQLNTVVKWLRDSACPGCTIAQRCCRIGQDLFSCSTVLKHVLSPTVLSAALQSVQKNRTAYCRDED